MSILNGGKGAKVILQPEVVTCMWSLWIPIGWVFGILRRTLR